MKKLLASITFALCALLGGVAHAATTCNNTTITSVTVEVSGGVGYVTALTGLGHYVQLTINSDIAKMQAATMMSAYAMGSSVTLYYTGTFTCSTVTTRTDLQWIALI